GPGHGDETAPDHEPCGGGPAPGGRSGAGGVGRCRGDRGASMMIWPAGFLVMIIIAAIGADLSRMYMARVSLEDLAATIANDVAAGAIDVRALRAAEDSETYQLDRNLALELGDRLIEARGDPAL